MTITTRQSVPTPPAIAAALLVSLLGAGLLAGCRGERSDAPPRQFFPDLDDSPKWKPQSASDFFADGRTMRVPPQGTVAFSRFGFTSQDDWAVPFESQRKDLLKDDQAFYTGKGSDGTFLVTMPVRLTKEDLLRGAERYNISCASCHNYNGDGLGTVGSQWSYPLPNFHDDIYVDPKNEKARDGYLFHIARNGVWSPDGLQNKMPGYAHALSYDDSWRVIAYIRVLQATRRGSLDDVPADKRDDMRRLLQQQPGTAPATTPATAPAAPATSGGAK